ncbi:hypothetical protein DVH05_009675 [Phytophthora capsici]|nr:hypothetical protein DVH05_009675 [Phytophthora capsici]
MSYSEGEGGYGDQRGYGSRSYDDPNRRGSGGHAQRGQEYDQRGQHQGYDQRGWYDQRVRYNQRGQQGFDSRGGRYGSSSGSRGYEGSRGNLPRLPSYLTTGNYGSGSGGYGSGGYDSRGGGSYSSHGAYGGSSRGYDHSRGSYGSSGGYDQSRVGYGGSSGGDQGRGGGYDDRGGRSYSSGRGYDDRSRIKLSLQCAIVGQTGSSFDVEIDDGEKVSKLKEMITEKNKQDPNLKNVAAKNLQLFLAKKGDAWLPDDDPAAQDLEEGKIHTEIKALIDGNKMKEAWTIEDVLVDNNMTGEGRAPKSRQIHVLAVVPGILTTIERERVDENQD